MDGFDEAKMKQLQMLKEKMKISKAQKADEVKKTEETFTHDVKNVRSFESEDLRYNKPGKRIVDVFPANRKIAHIKGNRYTIQLKNGGTAYTGKVKNGTVRLANGTDTFDTPLDFQEVMKRKNEKKRRELQRNNPNSVNNFMGIKHAPWGNKRGGMTTSSAFRGMNYRQGNMRNGKQDNKDGYNKGNNEDIHLRSTYSDHVEGQGNDSPKERSNDMQDGDILNGNSVRNSDSQNVDDTKEEHSFGTGAIRNTKSLNSGPFKNFFAQNGMFKEQQLGNTSPFSQNVLSESFPRTCMSNNGSNTMNWPGLNGNSLHRVKLSANVGSGDLGSGGFSKSAFSSGGFSSNGISSDIVDNDIVGRGSFGSENIDNGIVGRGGLGSDNVDNDNVDSNIVRSSGFGRDIVDSANVDSDNVGSSGFGSGGFGSGNGGSSCFGSGCFGSGNGGIGSSIFGRGSFSNSLTNFGRSNLFSSLAAKVNSQNDDKTCKGSIGNGVFNNKEVHGRETKPLGDSDGVKGNPFDLKGATNNSNNANDSLSGSRLSSTQNIPNCNGKNDVLDRTINSSGNPFSPTNNKVSIFNSTGSIFNKTTGITNSPFGSISNDNNCVSNNTSRKNIFGNVVADNNAFRKADNEKSIFGSSASGNNIFGMSTPGKNPFCSATSPIIGGTTESSRIFSNARGLTVGTAFNSCSDEFSAKAPGICSDKLVYDANGFKNEGGNNESNVVMNTDGNVLANVGKNGNVCENSGTVSKSIDLITTNNRLINESCNNRSRDGISGTVDNNGDGEGKKDFGKSGSSLSGFSSYTSMGAMQNKSLFDRNASKPFSSNELNSRVVKFNGTLSHAENMRSDFPNEHAYGGIEENVNNSRDSNNAQGECVRNDIRVHNGSNNSSNECTVGSSDSGGVGIAQQKDETIETLSNHHACGWDPKQDLLHASAENSNSRENDCDGDDTAGTNEGAEGKNILKKISNCFNNMIASTFSSPSRKTAEVVDTIGENKKEERIDNECVFQNLGISMNINHNSEVLLSEEKESKVEEGRISESMPGNVNKEAIYHQDSSSNNMERSHLRCDTNVDASDSRGTFTVSDNMSNIQICTVGNGNDLKTNSQTDGDQDTLLFSREKSTFSSKLKAMKKKLSSKISTDNNCNNIVSTNIFGYASGNYLNSNPPSNMTDLSFKSGPYQGDINGKGYMPSLYDTESRKPQPSMDKNEQKEDANNRSDELKNENTFGRFTERHVNNSLNINAHNFERKEDFEKYNQVYKNMNYINKNMNYVSKCAPATAEDVNNYVDANLKCTRNYDELSSFNKDFLETAKEIGNSVKTNEQIKSVVYDLSKNISRSACANASITEEEDRVVSSSRNMTTQLEFRNMDERSTNLLKSGNANEKEIAFSGCNFATRRTISHINNKKMTAMEKLMLINQRMRDISTSEEAYSKDKIPESAKKIMEREDFALKNKSPQSENEKKKAPRKIKPFVSSECSESFRNTFYPNENNTYNIFSLKNLSNLDILKTYTGYSNHNGGECDVYNNAQFSQGDVNAKYGEHMKMSSSSNSAKIPSTYFNEGNNNFKDSKMGMNNNNNMNTKNMYTNSLMYTNPYPITSIRELNRRIDYNAENDVYTVNNNINLLNSPSRVSEEKRAKYMSKMERELNSQTELITNIYGSLEKNNFIYGSHQGTNYDEGINSGSDKSNKVIEVRKRNYDNITTNCPNDNVQNENLFSVQKKKVKTEYNMENAEKEKNFSPNTNSERTEKGGNSNFINMSTYVREIRNAKTLEDISRNLSDYTMQSEKILCDLINDNLNMTLKISSLDDLPFLFEDLQ
ncbi:conserved Plasmodium protein, unknown function [Plasmodium ovale]|uniref:Uncharacterized protein n=2 Tax=Plasmodium ovale TaxID=36330 RepID=A0A1A8XBG7_PLAOA|nr:hypothetical protein POVCU1_078080 [Plasmodium ovale curtisi]SCQ17186.1 conserved Plasmodium protein, unknown function [Plasmodium ovale]